MSAASVIDKRLRVLIGNCAEEKLRVAMEYSVFAGGKRLRPMLLLACCEAVSGAYTETALDFACSVEMLHTYSLIHDDLPAMDNDDLRRGRATSHKVFGEAAAVLAGDALLSHAFETMAGICAKSRSNRPARAMLAIARGAGANGMVAGQMCDMEWENKKADAGALLSIHARKTAALISSCAEAGALLGGASNARQREMARLGVVIGLAFQIKDDLLDINSTAEKLGKPVLSDEKNHKNTYVTVHGQARAKADYKRLSEEAYSILAKLPKKTQALDALVKRILSRTH